MSRLSQDLLSAANAWSEPRSVPPLFDLSDKDLYQFHLDLWVIQVLADAEPACPDLVTRARELQERILWLPTLRFEHRCASRRRRAELDCAAQFSQTGADLARLYADLHERAKPLLAEENRRLDTTDPEDRYILGQAARCNELAAGGAPQLAGLSLSELRFLKQLLNAHHGSVKSIALFTPWQRSLYHQRLRPALAALDALLDARGRAEATWTRMGERRRTQRLGVAQLTADAQTQFDAFYAALGERARYILSLA